MMKDEISSKNTNKTTREEEQAEEKSLLIQKSICFKNNHFTSNIDRKNLLITKYKISREKINNNKMSTSRMLLPHQDPNDIHSILMINKLVSCKKKKKRIASSIYNRSTYFNKYNNRPVTFAILKKLMILAVLIVLLTSTSCSRAWRLFDLSESARSSYGFNPPPVNHNSQLLFPISTNLHHQHHQQQQQQQPQQSLQPQSLALIGTNGAGRGAQASTVPMTPNPSPITMTNQQLPPVYEQLIRNVVPSSLSYSSTSQLDEKAANSNQVSNLSQQQAASNQPTSRLQSAVSAAIVEAGSNLVKSVVADAAAAASAAINNNSDDQHSAPQQSANKPEMQRDADSFNNQQTSGRDASSLVEAFVSAVADNSASKYLASATEGQSKTNSNQENEPRSSANNNNEVANSINISNAGGSSSSSSSSISSSNSPSIIGKILDTTLSETNQNNINSNSSSPPSSSAQSQSQAIVDKLGSVAMQVLLKPRKASNQQTSISKTAAAAEQQIINQHATSSHQTRQHYNAPSSQQNYQRLLPTKQRDNKLVSYLLSATSLGGSSSSDSSAAGAASSSTSGQRDPDKVSASSKVLTSLLNNLKTGITSRSSIVKAAISDNKLARTLSTVGKSISGNKYAAGAAAASALAAIGLVSKFLTPYFYAGSYSKLGDPMQTSGSFLSPMMTDSYISNNNNNNVYGYPADSMLSSQSFHQPSLMMGPGGHSSILPTTSAQGLAGEPTQSFAFVDHPTTSWVSPAPPGSFESYSPPPQYHFSYTQLKPKTSSPKAKDQTSGSESNGVYTDYYNQQGMNSPERTTPLWEKPYQAQNSNNKPPQSENSLGVQSQFNYNNNPYESLPSYLSPTNQNNNYAQQSAPTISHDQFQAPGMGLGSNGHDEAPQLPSNFLTQQGATTTNNNNNNPQQYPDQLIASGSYQQPSYIWPNKSSKQQSNNSKEQFLFNKPLPLVNSRRSGAVSLKVDQKFKHKMYQYFQQQKPALTASFDNNDNNFSSPPQTQQISYVTQQVNQAEQPPTLIVVPTKTTKTIQEHPTGSSRNQKVDNIDNKLLQQPTSKPTTSPAFVPMAPENSNEYNHLTSLKVNQQQQAEPAKPAIRVAEITGAKSALKTSHAPINTTTTNNNNNDNDNKKWLSLLTRPQQGQLSSSGGFMFIQPNKNKPSYFDKQQQQASPLPSASASSSSSSESFNLNSSKYSITGNDDDGAQAQQAQQAREPAGKDSTAADDPQASSSRKWIAFSDVISGAAAAGDTLASPSQERQNKETAYDNNNNNDTDDQLQAAASSGQSASLSLAQTAPAPSPSSKPHHSASAAASLSLDDGSSSTMRTSTINGHQQVTMFGVSRTTNNDSITPLTVNNNSETQHQSPDSSNDLLPSQQQQQSRADQNQKQQEDSTSTTDDGNRQIR